MPMPGISRRMEKQEKQKLLWGKSDSRMGQLPGKEPEGSSVMEGLEPELGEGPESGEGLFSTPLSEGWGISMAGLADLGGPSSARNVIPVQVKVDMDSTMNVRIM